MVLSDAEADDDDDNDDIIQAAISRLPLVLAEFKSSHEL